MNILYLAAIRLPTEKAHGLQIMKTCEAFAQEGATVTLGIPGRHSFVGGDPFAYYGMPKNFTIAAYKVPDLIPFGPIGFLLTTLLFAERVHFEKIFWQADIIYSRDAYLLAQYVLLGRKLVYEAHQSPNGTSVFVAHTAFKVITISEGLRQAYIAAGIAPEKIIVAHDAIDLKSFAAPESKQVSRTRLGIPQDAKVALYVGRLDGWKGVDTLCTAAEYMPEIAVIAIGGEPAQVEMLSKMYPNVQFLGFRPYRELANNQAAADVLVLPNSGKDLDSVSYTSPLKLFSYMASGRPIVASDLPSIREILDDTMAFPVLPDDPEALARRIQFVIAHPKEAGERAAGALAAVAHHTWRGRARTILNALSQSVSESSRMKSPSRSYSLAVGLMHARAVRYLFAGCTGLAVNLGTIFVLVSIFHVWYLIGTVAAFIVSSIVSFSMQKLLTFEDRTIHHVHRQFGSFFGVALVNLGVNTLLMYGAVSIVGIQYLVAQFIVNALIAVYSFFLYKHFVFRPEQSTVRT